jgi:hypothetical protein
VDFGGYIFGKEELEDPRLVWRIILRLIFRKWDLRVLTGSI